MQDSITIRNIGFIATHNSTQQAFRRQVHITHCHTVYIAVFADDNLQSLGLCALQQGYGYNVQFLYEEIGKIMGLNTEHRIIIIGAGNLGQALANYVKFEKLGFVITALFDVNPELSGKSVRGIPILMLSELDEYCRTHRVDIAALTMPKSKADSIASKLVDLGIRAIWNFAHVDLEIPNKDVVVESVHLSDSLMQLSYNIVKNSKNK